MKFTRSIFRHRIHNARALDDVLLAQGTYFFITGVWPLLSMRSFLKVTGPKRDLWLVKTVAVLVAAVGSVMAQAGFHQRVERNTINLAKRSATVLAAIDTWFVLRKLIPPIYLADALIEAGFIGIIRSLEQRQ
jgi:hypothetical protein